MPVTIAVCAAVLALILFLTWIIAGERGAVDAQSRAMVRVLTAEQEAAQAAADRDTARKELEAARAEISRLQAEIARTAPAAAQLAEAVRS